MKGERKGLAGAVCSGKFAHEEVGIEEKQDECNLDHRAPKRGEETRGIGVAGHEGMVQDGDEVAWAVREDGGRARGGFPGDLPRFAGALWASSESAWFCGGSMGMGFSLGKIHFAFAALGYSIQKML